VDFRKVRMTKSSKLVAVRKGRILLVRRRSDQLWTFPGGKRNCRQGESSKACLTRELQEELPNMRLGLTKLWRKVEGKNPISGRKMSDAVYVAQDISGSLAIGAKNEIDKVKWCRTSRSRLTPTSAFIRDKLFPDKK
jgi:8-oxo-dGTP diphosphatase